MNGFRQRLALTSFLLIIWNAQFCIFFKTLLKLLIKLQVLG